MITIVSKDNKAYLQLSLSTLCNIKENNNIEVTVLDTDGMTATYVSTDSSNESTYNHVEVKSITVWLKENGVSRIYSGLTDSAMDFDYFSVNSDGTVIFSNSSDIESKLEKARKVVNEVYDKYGLSEQYEEAMEEVRMLCDIERSKLERFLWQSLFARFRGII